MRVVKRIITACNYALAAAAAAILFVVLVAVCWATISRYLFHEPYAFLVDLSGYALVFLAFLAAPWLMSKGAHVRIDFLIAMTSPRVERYWNTATDFITAIIALAITYPAIQLTTDFFSKNRVMQDSLKTPQWILLLPIVVGSLFVAIQAILNGVEQLRSTETDDASIVPDSDITEHRTDS